MTTTVASLISRSSKVHTEAVWSICWSKSNANKFYSGSLDGKLLEHNITDAGEIEVEREFSGHDLGIIDIAVMSNHKLVTSSLDNCVRVFNTESGEMEKLIECGSVDCWTISLNKLETLVATGTHTGHINIHQIAVWGEDSTEAPISLNCGKGFFIMCVCFEPMITDAETKQTYELVAGDRDGNVFWFLCSAKEDATSQQSDFRLVESKPVHMRAVRHLAYGANNDKLFTCGDDMIVKIFETKNRTEIAAIHGHRSWVMCVVPSLDTDSNMFISGSNDKTVKIYESKTGKNLQTLKCTSDELQQIKLNAKGDRFVFGAGTDIYLYSMVTK